MRTLALALIATFVATSHSSAQLPLLDDNDLVYAHHHLNVPDIGEARKFWVDTLGGTPAAAGPLQMVKFPNVIIVFTERAPTGGSKGTTVNHVGFYVPSVRKMIDRVKAAGYPIVTREEVPPSQTVKDGIAYIESTKTNIAYTMLPEGTKVEFVENPSVKVPVSNHHVHFATDKIDEMQAWYVKTFGARAGMRGTFKAADLPGVNLTFGGTAEPVVGTRGRAIDHIGFEVKNLEAFCKQLEAQGITFDRPYTFIPQ
ncbi:MAG TPA: VOC family protein, partial [Vicinamibacterales bacterium]|nr:VOC family protein [Vicinamibacterales bacterium]